MTKRKPKPSGGDNFSSRECILAKMQKGRMEPMYMPPRGMSTKSIVFKIRDIRSSLLTAIGNLRLSLAAMTSSHVHYSGCFERGDLLQWENGPKLEKKSLRRSFLRSDLFSDSRWQFRWQFQHRKLANSSSLRFRLDLARLGWPFRKLSRSRRSHGRFAYN